MLHTSTPDNSGYHENKMAAVEVDEICQDDELPCSFNIDPDLALNSLLDNANDVTIPGDRKPALRKKKRKILNVLYISYYVFDEYSLVLVLSRMSNTLNSVMKNHFGGKSRAGTTDTLF
jgi:hypothetical protein